MMPDRIRLQIECLTAEGGLLCQGNSNEENQREREGDGEEVPDIRGAEGASTSKSTLLVVGSQFTRIPEDATRHYTAWANNLTT